VGVGEAIVAFGEIIGGAAAELLNGTRGGFVMY